MIQPRIQLEQLRIEKPCPADWDAMATNDRGRFCETCQKQVHDLSAMPREEAERLVCEAAGRLCVRMVVHVPVSPVAVGYQGSLRSRPRKGWKFWTGIGLIGAGLAAMANAWQGRQAVPLPPAAAAPQTMPVIMLGDICPPSPGRTSPAVDPSNIPIPKREG